MPDDAKTPRRKVITPARDDDGLIIQPKDVGPDREVIEHQNRMNFAEHFHYADPWTGNTRTYDPTGNYRCGDCNKRAMKQDGAGLDDDDCLLVPIDIDLKCGSCEHWENTCAGDREINLQGIISAREADYGEAKNGQGFGCFRCPFSEKAAAPDSRGRTLYCRKGDFRVLRTACCALNGAALKKLSDKVLDMVGEKRGGDDDDRKSLRGDLEAAYSKAEK